MRANGGGSDPRHHGPFATSDWCKITGYGHVAVCDSRTFPETVHVGDLVSFIGREGSWRVAGIEMTRKNGVASPWIGLRVYPAKEAV